MKKIRTILINCIYNYPSGIEDANIRAILTMKNAFYLPVGYSDHSQGRLIPIAAVSLGACVIEKHFTLNKSLSGPDHPFALEPNELKNMVQAIRDTQASLGSPVKKHTKAEEEMYKLGRRSLVAACNIPKGTKITKGMLDIKRPGYGIHSKMMDIVVGRTAKINIKEDDILTWEMI